MKVIEIHISNKDIVLSYIIRELMQNDIEFSFENFEKYSELCVNGVIYRIYDGSLKRFKYLERDFEYEKPYDKLETHNLYNELKLHEYIFNDIRSQNKKISKKNTYSDVNNNDNLVKETISDKSYKVKKRNR